MKKFYALQILFFSTLITAKAQNISVNTTGAANSTSSMFEVLQPSGTSGTSGLFVRHSGTTTTAYGLWVEMTGTVTNKYAIIVPSGSGNVGFGTSTPASALSIVGSAVTSTAHSSFGSTQWRMKLNAGDEANSGTIDYRGFDATALGIVGAGTGANRLIRMWEYLGINTAPTTNQALKVSGSGATYAGVFINGNVGVGTTTPQRTLDISNAGQLTFGDDVVTNSTNGIYWHSGSGYSLARTTGPWSAPNYQQLLMQFSTGITIDGGSAYGLSGTILQPAAGNVAIGQAVKGAYNLEINGSFGFGDGSAGSYRSRTESRADAGLMGSQSGFFQTSAPSPGANWNMIPAQNPSPSPYLDINGNAINWWHLIDTRHSNNANNYAMQIAGSFFDQDFYVRKTNNNGAQQWAKVMTAQNSYGSNVKYASGTSDISINTATYTDMTDMTITFTPVHSTVIVIFSCSGYGSTAGYLEYVHFRLLKDGVAKGGTSTVATDYDDVYGQTISWNASLHLPVAVTPGVSTTMKIQWKRNGNGPAAIYNYPTSAPDGDDHRTLFILD